MIQKDIKEWKIRIKKYNIKTLFLNLTSFRLISELFIKESKYQSLREHASTLSLLSYNEEVYYQVQNFINYINSNFKNICIDDIPSLFYCGPYSTQSSPLISYIQRYMEAIYLNENDITRRNVLPEDLNKDYIILGFKKDFNIENLITYKLSLSLSPPKPEKEIISKLEETHNNFKDQKIIVFNETKVDISERNNIPVFFNKGIIQGVTINSPVPLIYDFFDIVEDKNDNEKIL